MNNLVINTPILSNVITLIKIKRNVFLVKIKAIHQKAFSDKAFSLNNEGPEEKVHNVLCLCLQKEKHLNLI